MRVGDVAAPGALLTPSHAAAAAASGAAPAPGSTQRAFREQRAAAVVETPRRQEQGREAEARSRRLQQAAHALEIVTEHRLEDESAGSPTEASLAALRSFGDRGNLDVGDRFGLIGSDERVRDVMRSLGELAQGLAERPRDPEQAAAPGAAAPETPVDGARPPLPDANGMRGFSRALESREARLEDRADLLRGVVAALERSAPADVGPAVPRADDA